MAAGEVVAVTVTRTGKSGKKYKLTGPQPVRCKNCGARGVANRAYVGYKRTVPSCRFCKEERA